MSMYIPVIVWMLSAGICYYIAKRKNIKPAVLWNLTFVFLGPIAIPIILLIKSKKHEINGDVNKNTEILRF